VGRPMVNLMRARNRKRWIQPKAAPTGRHRYSLPDRVYLRQPFRSMGFVSVIIVSVLFALGLPLGLL